MEKDELIKLSDGQDDLLVHLPSRTILAQMDDKCFSHIAEGVAHLFVDPIDMGLGDEWNWGEVIEYVASAKESKA